MASFPLRVGESIIPLSLAIPRRRSADGVTSIRPVRWIDAHSPVIQRRFRDLSYFIDQQASYDTATTVPTRAKGKAGAVRRLPEGYKPLQVLVQPECGLYREDGTFIPNDDALCFYDMDRLPMERLFEAYERLRGLQDQGRAFVWMNAIHRPKAAFWVRLKGSMESHQAMLLRIHQEVFQGDPACAPALGPSDMWKSFIHSVEVLEGMRLFFAEAYRRHVQIIHDAARSRERTWQEQRQTELDAALNLDPEQVIHANEQANAEQHQASIELPSPQDSWISDLLGGWKPGTPIPDAFGTYLDQEFAPRLEHGIRLPLYEEPLPRELFGRKASRLQELVIRFALSMPERLLHEGVGIPSPLIQKLAHQHYPELFNLRFDASGNLDASGASKAIGQLVARGILEVTDHTFRPGTLAKRYRAIHPELIALARERAHRGSGSRFSERTVDDVDRRWQELTGQSLADTIIDGIRDQVIYRLTNFCPTYGVFEEAALRIPGMRQGKDRQRFLPTQWKAHVERDRTRAGAIREPAPQPD
jgi:hypothetical protein